MTPATSSTFSSYELFQSMKDAYKLFKTNPTKGLPRVHELLGIAKEMNQKRFGIWEKAVEVVDKVEPDRIKFGDRDLVDREIFGYPSQAIRYMDEKKEKVKDEFIALFHPNGYCYVRWIIKGGNVVF